MTCLISKLLDSSLVPVSKEQGSFAGMFDWNLGLLDSVVTHQFEIPIGFDRWEIRRKAEFIAGRMCAVKAMASIGKMGGSIGISTFGPAWPDQTIGSITHKKNLAWCVVRETVNPESSLGIDVENLVDSQHIDRLYRIVHCLSPQLGSEVNEYFHVGWTKNQYLTLLFSLYESYFKCMSPVLKTNKIHAPKIAQLDDGRGVFTSYIVGMGLVETSFSFEFTHDQVFTLVGFDGGSR